MKTLNSLLIFMVLALATFQGNAQNSLTDGLVAFYPLVGNANDVSGNGNNGTIQAATLTTNQFGTANSAYYFNGTGSSIILPQAAFADLQQGTIAAWIYLDVNNHGVIFAQQYDGDGSFGVLSVGSYCATSGSPVIGTPGTLYFHPRNGSDVAASSIRLPTGAWCHVAVAFSTTNCNFYINGVRTDTYSGGFNISDNDPYSITTIGAWESNAENAYYDVLNGIIDNLLIYNRALSATEISQLFGFGLGGLGDNVLITAQPVSVSTNQYATVTLSVAAKSNLALSYQWQFNGTNLIGATNTTFIIPDVQFDNTGIYDVLVSNSSNSVASASVSVSIAIPNAPLIYVNSTLATAAASALGTATVSLTAGFPGGLILFALTGDNEDGAYQIYTGPFTITNSVYITAMGYNSDFSESAEMQPLALQIIPLYNLTTSVVGGGTVNVDPTSNPFPSNNIVTLTATASPEWVFDHWQGSMTNYGNPLTLPVDTNLNLQAVFVPTPFALTLNTVGGGTVLASGETADGTDFASNSVVTLLASNAPGWTFLEWQGGVNSTSNPCIFTITQTLSVQGMFGTSPLTKATGGGHILLNNTNLIPYGSNVTASAVANNGNYFVAWGGAASGTSSPVDITMDASTTIDALFLPLPPKKVSLSVAISGNGLVSISPQQAYYNPGDIVTLTAIPNAASVTFDGWASRNDGINVTTITMTTNLIVYADFSELPPISPASAVAIMNGGSCASAAMTSGGAGYTNIPAVTIFGGGGSGATATAVIQGGAVVAVVIVNGGNGYTNAPQIIIQPPLTLIPQVSITAASCLTFSNLSISTVYRLQRQVNQNWKNVPIRITATNSVMTLWVNGTATANSYRLVASPVPTTATATAITYYGFVVSATITSGGSGYTVAPAVTILGGGGNGATATATVSNGVIAGITIVNAGSGYTNIPSFTIAAPPVTGEFSTIQPGIILGMSNLMTNQIYQLQYATQLNNIWQILGNVNFLTLSNNQNQYIFTTNNSAYYRLHYLP